MLYRLPAILLAGLAAIPAAAQQAGTDAALAKQLSNPVAALISIPFQYNWNTGYGGAELGLSYPITKHVRLYTQVYSGYGESLIDYNFNQTRVGVGVMLNDLF